MVSFPLSATVVLGIVVTSDRCLLEDAYLIPPRLAALDSDGAKKGQYKGIIENILALIAVSASQWQGHQNSVASRAIRIPALTIRRAIP
jgi:hypothetical protein